MAKKWNRRRVLKGMLGGSAVTVALPLLDCFLDGNGQALASGAPIPVRFGTWFWGCGINAARWIPDKVGADYDLKAELLPIAAVQEEGDRTLGFQLRAGRQTESCSLVRRHGDLDRRGSLEGRHGQRHGRGADDRLPRCRRHWQRHTLSVARSRLHRAVGRQLQHARRLDRQSERSRSGQVCIRRIFGPEYQDPNAGEFKPDPAIMLRQSVLSSVKDEREALLRTVGAADRARVDQYFTSLRDIEQQLGLMLEKPAPADACVKPKEPAKNAARTDVGDRGQESRCPGGSRRDGAGLQSDASLQRCTVDCGVQSAA